MSKLDTTVDKIELTTNKIINGVPNPEWSDKEYPSARTLYNTYSLLSEGSLLNSYPVGSVYITTERTQDPKDIIGGTWELIDREFKQLDYVIDENIWESTTTVLEFPTKLDAATVLGSMIKLDFSIQFLNNVNLSEIFNYALGNLSIDSFGAFGASVDKIVCTRTSSDFLLLYRLSLEKGDIAYLRGIAAIDLTNGGRTEVPAGTTVDINETLEIPVSCRLVYCCDKFYWKRTA